MNIKSLIILISIILSSYAMSAQLENPIGFNYTKQNELRMMRPITRLRISDAELIASGSLFALGLMLPYLDKNNSRQGAEIACFAFGLTLFFEGKRMRGNVKNKPHVRYHARRKIPASKF